MIRRKISKSRVKAKIYNVYTKELENIEKEFSGLGTSMVTVKRKLSKVLKPNEKLLEIIDVESSYDIYEMTESDFLKHATKKESKN